MRPFAIITGGSRGVGFGVAQYFAKQNYDIALVARNPKQLEHAKQEIQHQHLDLEILTAAVDVQDGDKAYHTIKELITTKGKIDVLFNNAGIFLTGSSDLSIQDFKAMLEVNVLGAFSVAKAACEVMKKQQSGYIFNLASMSGKRGLANLGGYCSSKFAVVGLSDSLFAEMMPYHVKVTAICPSIINTDMTKDADIPNDQKIQVSDIVKTVDYLLKLSDHAVLSSVDIQAKSLLLQSQ